MATKKTAENRIATRSAKKAEAAADYRRDLALKRARLSGSALKASTAANEGTYTIENRNNGGSVVLRALFASAFPKKEVVPAEDFRAALSSLFSGENKGVDSAVEKALSAYASETGKEYKNFSTLRSRLNSDIRRGLILSFRLDSKPARG